MTRPHIEVIAEIGVNHDGDVTKAHDLIDAASQAGAQTVKTQSFITELLVSRVAPKSPYQLRNNPGSNNQFEMLKDLELSFDEQVELKSHAESLGLTFLSTPFDQESLRFLVQELQLPRVKIASSDIVSVPLLFSVGESGLDVLLSTGLTEALEVDLGLAALAGGFTGIPIAEITPNGTEVILQNSDARSYLNKKVTLLHCVSAYPAPTGSLNLRVIQTLRSKYGLPVGYSDHSEGHLAAIAAVALGAVMIEKHLTLDRSSDGPDHRASMEPLEFADLCSQVKLVAEALGDGRRLLTDAEIENRKPARKQVIATREISVGELFSPQNIGIRRPCELIPASEFSILLGSRASRHYKEGDAIAR